MTCVLCASPLADATIVNTVARNEYPQTCVACPRCAFVQESPMPTADEMAAYYADGSYRREFPPLRSEAEEVDLANDAAEWLAVNLAPLPSDRLLEIGCGYGRVAALLGASVLEADPAMLSEAIGRGARAHVDGDVYSIVYAMQVLEHQTDPVATLREWRRYLAPHGRIHVQVPTLERMYGGASHFFQRPHVVNFTERTLRIALRLAGFDGITSGIGGQVLAATATLDEACAYDEIESLGPIDDVPALIAAHEQQRVDVQPSDVERWLASDGPRPGDDVLRHALTHFAGLASTAIDGVARLSQAAEQRTEIGDAAWSLNPWVLGYQAGTQAADQRYQQATAQLANALRMKAMS